MTKAHGNFNREDYLSCTDIARLAGSSYAYTNLKLNQAKLYPDKAWGKNRYWKKDREYELVDAVTGGMTIPEQIAKKNQIKFDDSFFDFDPIPEYFRRIEDDEV